MTPLFALLLGSFPATATATVHARVLRPIVIEGERPSGAAAAILTPTRCLDPARRGCPLTYDHP